MMTNPYESPATAAVPPEHTTRSVSILHLVLWFYPVLLVMAVYGTWLVAWAALGHVPRPSLDDPKSISVVVDMSYLLTAVLLYGFLAAAPAGILLQLTAFKCSWLTRCLRCVLLAAFWAFSIWLLRWDPLSVVEWYFD